MEGDETESLGTALTLPNDIDGKRDSDSFEPISLLEEDDLGSEQYEPGGAVRAPKRRRRKKSKASSPCCHNPRLSTCPAAIFSEPQVLTHPGPLHPCPVCHQPRVARWEAFALGRPRKT